MPLNLIITSIVLQINKILLFRNIQKYSRDEVNVKERAGVKTLRVLDAEDETGQMRIDLKQV
jgi:hypothetical protein